MMRKPANGVWNSYGTMEKLKMSGAHPIDVRCHMSWSVPDWAPVGHYSLTSAGFSDLSDAHGGVTWPNKDESAASIYHKSLHWDRTAPEVDVRRGRIKVTAR